MNTDVEFSDRVLSATSLPGSPPLHDVLLIKQRNGPPERGAKGFWNSKNPKSVALKLNKSWVDVAVRSLPDVKDTPELLRSPAAQEGRRLG